MADVIHLIDGREFEPPRNWEDLEITIDWLNKKEPGGVPNLTELVFAGRGAAYLNERFKNGLTGGVGIFEGVKYEILIGRPGNPSFIFNGYLDGADGLTVYGQEEIVVSLKKEAGTDWLNDVADAFSFAYLYDEGIIINSDFVKVPYVINYVPDGMQLIVISLSSYMMAKELIENVQSISESVADVTDAAAPVVGVGLGRHIQLCFCWRRSRCFSNCFKPFPRIGFYQQGSVVNCRPIHRLTSSTEK